MAEEAVLSSRYNLRGLRVEGRDDAARLLRELGTDKGGVAIMSTKMSCAAISAENVQARASHILKQVMLSRGGDCATPREVFLVEGTERVRVIIMGTERQLRAAVRNLSVQPFGLKALASELKSLIDSGLFSRRERELRAGEHVLVVGGRTLVMGIVNVTPDSFSDGGWFYDFDVARAHALAMAEAGADLIDIGGESTRPGAEPVSEEEEERRTVPLIEALVGEIDIPISIDTYKSSIARKALDAGASIVNDISSLRLDPGLAPLIASRGVPVILMHMQGMPGNMQDNPAYEDVAGEISDFLLERAEHACASGIDPGQVLIDPGIGFGKSPEHNVEIIRRIGEFGTLGYPVVLGPSRKRFLGAITGKEVTERMMGTAASVAFAIARGVDVVRVHDVAEMREVVKVADAIAGKERPW